MVFSILCESFPLSEAGVIKYPPLCRGLAEARRAIVDIEIS